ncbi:MAG: HAMP domain-containing histidine kinase [Deltaproteobacteria bacterium]|nr:HAMP domain-containing histidine kinase [Deltaproteobacteria bacterium]
MFLKRLNQIQKTVGFRLTFWYFAILILSALSLFGLTYILLSSSLEDQDHESIEIKIDEISSFYQAFGIKALQREFDMERKYQKKVPFFIRFAGTQDETLFLILPYQWIGFDMKALESANFKRDEEWIHLPLKDGKYALEVKSTYITGGYILQVGKSTEDREKILERFRNIFTFIMIPLMIIGLVGGALLAYNALRPIRNLIQTVQDIMAGKMHSRVPSYKTGDELDKLVVLFNEMLSKIETLIQGMGETLDHVAHDLRTPMARMRIGAELALQPTKKAEDVKEALSDCMEESDRILTMLNTLMDISEAETGAMTLDLRDIDIAEMIMNVVDLYQYVTEDKGIQVEITLPRGLQAHADPVRMRQVLGNLLDNAIKYTPKGGMVQIEAGQVQEGVVITVRDTGVGIPGEDIPRIWDRLYRGDRSRSQRGLGLGLSLVKAIVNAHKGRIEVESELDKGSAFRIVLPK